MPDHLKRSISEEQLAMLKDAASKAVSEQIKRGNLSKYPPSNWQGSTVGEVVFYIGKPIPLYKYASEIASQVCKEKLGTDIEPHKLGIGPRASPNEKILVEYIKEEIRLKGDTILAEGIKK